MVNTNINAEPIILDNGAEFNVKRGDEGTDLVMSLDD
jgi:hypothetical protein